MSFATAWLAYGEMSCVRGQPRLVTIDARGRGPLMGISNGDVTVVILDDGTGRLVPYRIDDAFGLADEEAHAVGDYTVLVQVGDDAGDPVIVRALDADVPSFVGIGDADEARRTREEYDARLARRSLTLV